MSIKKSIDDYQLTIFYKNKKYLWSDLKLLINSNQSKSLILLKNKVFDSSLLLIYAFLKKKILLTEVYQGAIVNDPSIALAITTSGSQAKPKIALITRQNIFSHCYHFVKIIPINTTSIWLNCMPLNHIAGVMIIYRCWFNDAHLLLHQGFDTKKVWSDIKYYAVTHISLVPRMLFNLLEFSQDAQAPKSLQYALIGGDKLSEGLYQRAISAGWPIFMSYGMTEASSTVAIGKTPHQLKILEGFSAQTTQEGILKLKGNMIFSAYADNTLKLDKQQWFITHDKVILDQGFLSIIGRNDNMIISGGENIAPEFIESLLISQQLSTDFFSDIAVSHYQHDHWGHTIIALVCQKNHKKTYPSIEQFKFWLKDNISSDYRPRKLIKVDKIPRNSMGKIKRSALQELITSSHFK